MQRPRTHGRAATHRAPVATATTTQPRAPVAAAIVRSLVHHGTLSIAVGDAAPWSMTGPLPGPAVGLRFANRRVFTACALDPALRVGEAYMDGTLRIEHGTLADFLQFALLNTEALSAGRWARVLGAVRQLRGFVRRRRGGDARRFVAHHYDLGNELFELFLDPDMQYSCAYFAPGDDLSAAQARKKRRIAAKLLLGPGQRVLDIGSGWGGLAMTLAQLESIRVDGVTLSQEQHSVSVRRAADAGLADRVRFDLKDYRDLGGQYDRIVSVGMLEHVGRSQLGTFFKKVAALLAADGVALIHAIGSFRDPGPRQPWLEKYIFPGSFLPPLDLVCRAVQEARLRVTDVEIWQPHYADTLQAWRERFSSNRERVRALYDDRFVRMWDFYLTACEMVFRTGQAMVFQVQLARSHRTVPPRRDYIDRFERQHEVLR